MEVWRGSQIRARIHGSPVHEDLVVKMRPRHVPRGSGQAEQGPLLDALSTTHADAREMTVQSLNPIPVIDHDRLAVPISPAGEDHRARCTGPARGRGIHADVDPAVKTRQRAARPKVRGDRTTHRPAEPQAGHRPGPCAARGAIARHVSRLRPFIIRRAAIDRLREPLARADPLLLTRLRGRWAGVKDQRERQGRAGREGSHRDPAHRQLVCQRL